MAAVAQLITLDDWRVCTDLSDQGSGACKAWDEPPPADFCCCVVKEAAAEECASVCKEQTSKADAVTTDSYDACYAKCVAQETKEIAAERSDVSLLSSALHYCLSTLPFKHSKRQWLPSLQPHLDGISNVLAVGLHVACNSIQAKPSLSLICMMTQFKKSEEELDKSVESKAEAVSQAAGSTTP